MRILNEGKRSRVSDLKTLNKNLESFAFRVSHDLLSPVNALKTLVSLIEEETKEESTLEYIRMVKNRVFHLDQTIRNNLKNSKNSASELQISSISIEETVREAAEIFSHEMKTLGIRFEINIQQKEAFFSDKFRLNTLLENLIANAVKYHNNVSLEKEIVVEGYLENDRLQLKVSDNGIGIATAYQEKIFDQFFRASNTIEGYGIGLYIVKQTVEILGGTVQVKSVQGKGTCFILELKNFKDEN
ncbi:MULTISPECIES: sensor histidine kinase [Flavobacterium]|uniref:sensor histidine kinase n=1 Tax=Flavobacterium TaxID=237 RepID=UPI0011827CD1|nr:MULTISPECIES: HAMP domain-containing sensor histidine kinase [Flavobacterium]MCR4029657.1 HAMP domain-containing histidine kinase [Flavobacterium panacis]